MTIFNLNNYDRDFYEKLLSPMETIAHKVTDVQNYYAGLSNYLNEFMIPYLIAVNYFSGVENSRLLTTSPLESFRSYMELFEFNFDIYNRYMLGSLRAINNYSNKEMLNALNAWFNTFLNLEGENVEKFIAGHSKMIESVAKVYPQAIRDAESESGFHFERGENIRVAETDRFILWQINPTDNKIKVNNNVKPILLLPPYGPAGADFMAILVGENRSYTHYYANMGIPTYIRIVKDIETTPAVQVLTGEEDARDTRLFCETITAIHRKPVTLSGYCQGGFYALCNILSGELDGLVDALITLASPIDGTRNKTISAFLKSLPQRFNDLAYGTKIMTNGNKVIDGQLLSWVFKMTFIESKAPIVSLIRDMMKLSPKKNGDVKIPKADAALDYWLTNLSDIPLCPVKMSFDSHNIPITRDGTLPVKLFDRELNLKRIKEKGIKWLICYGEKDSIVTPEAALAPLDYIDTVEVTQFPGDHLAMATLWSDPRSACALHTRYGPEQYRGPVRFQLDLDEELSKYKN